MILILDGRYVDFAIVRIEMTSAATEIRIESITSLVSPIPRPITMTITIKPIARSKKIAEFRFMLFVL